MLSLTKRLEKLLFIAKIDSVENKPAISLVVFLGKALDRMPLPRQEVN